MAMLAGPRRKQKVINLRAKNSSWSNDSNKFGQRMLEKMGWSSGKGLGAKEDGIVEHVVARYKNDEKGLGFEDKNDQWTKHEDDFNALLANLSNSDKKEDSKTQEDLRSGFSLEAKSKTSKARIHYHKFTRGKDLSKYSEKDLANIFGKKSLKEEKVDKETLKEDVTDKEQIFTDKGSMEDYFKNKLSSLKTINKNYQPVTEDASDHDDYKFCGFSGTGSNNPVDLEDEQAVVGFQGFSCYTSNEIDNTTQNEEKSEENIKKSKKNKKSKNKTIDENVDNCEQPNSEKKSKKSKKNKCHVEENQILDDSSLLEDEKKSKKSKKRKYLDVSESKDQSYPNNEENIESEVIKSKKKKKKKAKENE